MSERESPWKQQAEAFGKYLRMQRQLADLSLRELASMTSVSNAYLSQLERGMHQPSVRVLRSLADALGVSAGQFMAQFGGDSSADVADEPAATDTDAAPDSAGAGVGPSSGRTGNFTEHAIFADPRLTDAQKQSLVEVYRAFLGD